MEMAYNEYINEYYAKIGTLINKLFYTHNTIESHMLKKWTEYYYFILMFAILNVRRRTFTLSSQFIFNI